MFKLIAAAAVATMASATQFNGLDWLKDEKDFAAAEKARAEHMRQYRHLVRVRGHKVAAYFKSKAWAIRKHAEMRRWDSHLKTAIKAHEAAIKRHIAAHAAHKRRTAARRHARRVRDTAEKNYRH